MPPVGSRTYDTIKLPNSKRNTRILVANTGATINRDHLQVLRQQFVTDVSYSRGAGIFVGGPNIQQPASTGGSSPYSLHDPDHDAPSQRFTVSARPNEGVGTPDDADFLPGTDPESAVKAAEATAELKAARDASPKPRRQAHKDEAGEGNSAAGGKD